MQDRRKFITMAVLAWAAASSGAQEQPVSEEQALEMQRADRPGDAPGKRVQPPPKPSVETRIEPGVPERERNKREHGHHDGRGHGGGKPPRDRP